MLVANEIDIVRELGGVTTVAIARLATVGESTAELGDDFLEASAYLEHIRYLPMDTREQYDEAAKSLKKIAAALKTLELKRKKIVAPARESLAEISDLFGRPMDKLEQAMRVLKDAMLGYMARAQVRETIALQDAVIESNAGNREKAVALISSAAAETTNVVGINTRDVYKFEITDVTLIPQERLIEVLTKTELSAAMARLATKYKGDVEIPGLKVWTEKDLTVRSAS